MGEGSLIAHFCLSPVKHYWMQLGCYYLLCRIGMRSIRYRLPRFLSRGPLVGMFVGHDREPCKNG